MRILATFRLHLLAAPSASAAQEVAEEIQERLGRLKGTELTGESGTRRIGASTMPARTCLRNKVSIDVWTLDMSRFSPTRSISSSWEALLSSMKNTSRTLCYTIRRTSSRFKPE